MQKIFKVKAVIFDRDGVIIDSQILTIDSARVAFKQLGFTLLDEDIPYIIGRSSFVFTDYFQIKWDFDPEKFREIYSKYFYDNLDSLPFFVDAVDLVIKLHKQGITLAMTTSAKKESTISILNKVSIEQMFKVIVTKEDCIQLKPDPEPYITTVHKLGLEPQFCIAIEDTALGVEAAKNAGMLCIAIPNQFTDDQDFSRADAVVQSAKEIEKMLEFIV